MNKIIAVFIVTIIMLTTISVTDAQQSKKEPRLGYLSGFEPAGESSRSEAIQLALRERGYVEGQNIATEYRYAEGSRSAS